MGAAQLCFGAGQVSGRFKTVAETFHAHRQTV
jgi:hypothetical protein